MRVSVVLQEVSVIATAHRQASAGFQYQKPAPICPLSHVFLARPTVSMNCVSKHGGAREPMKQPTIAHQPVFVAYA